VRRAAARLQCANNLKQISLALHCYADTHPVALTAGKSVASFPSATVPNLTLPVDQRLSWVIEVLPFLDKEDLSRRFDRAVAWDAPGNTVPGGMHVNVFRCPDWVRELAPESASIMPYIGVAGLGPDAPLLSGIDRRVGVFGYERRTPMASITDGASNTLLVLETAHENGPWAQGGWSTIRALDPADQPYLGSGRPFGGTHFTENGVFRRGASIGCNAAMADGSVRFLHEGIAPNILEALATIGGGEKISDDW
jgi:hypothetical protein